MPDYGKYPIPQAIKQLADLANMLEQEGYSLDPYLHIRLEEYGFRYHITPLDLIPFMSTGGDGIHFGFLTEFGAVKHLEEAYIVCVSPTNDPPLRVVARHLRDFLRLVCTFGDAELVEGLNTVKTEQDFRRFLERADEWKEEEDSVYLERKKYVTERFKRHFSIEPMENPYAYLQTLWKERDERIAANTFDTLGVFYHGEEEEAILTFSYPENRDEVPVHEIKRFFATASRTSKLAFFRNALYWWVLPYHPELNRLLKEELFAMGLTEEAKRLKWYE
jgi:hypothetical protein